jgi:hypothetical protein
MKIRLAVFLLVFGPALQACQPAPPKDNFASAEANEAAAFGNLSDEDNEIIGAGTAVQGMLPDANGHVPLANVQ